MSNDTKCFVRYTGPPRRDDDNEFDLELIFSQFGTITSVYYDEYKSFAFVEFSTHDAAAFAIYSLNGSNHGGRKLRVNWALKRDGEEEQRDSPKTSKKGEEKTKKEEEEKTKKEEEKTKPVEPERPPIGGKMVESKGNQKVQKKQSKQQVKEIIHTVVQSPPTTQPIEETPKTNDTKNQDQNKNKQQDQNKNKQPKKKKRKTNSPYNRQRFRN